ncbi:response regulator [Pseudomonas sp. LPB0260]|uniref:response regulator transcription factor n=1 Tax=unclassified Pseudomonas TaxID=196821 RepID=UPI0015C1C6D1|nr:response regulator [Pseudomonas sp. LPB0260]QLC73791.1 response regulator [Pseudomonas sp. LPB0260]QLC76565.1 response regulator [Pseudomonas sp. LPB0260]
MSRTVLIADDEPNIVISLEFLLQQEGYRVQVAHDGQEAWEAIQRQPPDLVLLDVMMPRLSGFDVCQKIRENPAWQQLPIVMLTAKGREVEVSKGLALGADAYISKPFSTQELLAQVRALLGDA